MFTDEQLKEFYDKATSMSSLETLVYGYSNGTSKKKIVNLYWNTGLDLSELRKRKGQSKVKYNVITKTCPICSASFETQEGHKKEKVTCSIACSNTHFRTGENHGNYKPEALRYTDGRTKHVSPSTYYGKPENLGKSRSEIQKEYYRNEPPEKKQLRSERMSAFMEKRIAAGLHKGWASRSQPSYPEKFWMEVLKNNNLEYTFELKQGKYFIDFAFPDKMIALEIDGQQHELPDRKISDELKDAYLTSIGWSVYRIKWKNINNEAGKTYIKNEIINFLKTYEQTNCQKSALCTKGFS